MRSKEREEKQFRKIYTEENKVKKLKEEASSYENTIKDKNFEINSLTESNNKMKNSLHEIYYMGL